jgi:hypothetical protein
VGLGRVRARAYPLDEEEAGEDSGDDKDGLHGLAP